MKSVKIIVLIFSLLLLYNNCGSIISSDFKSSTASPSISGNRFGFRKVSCDDQNTLQFYSRNSAPLTKVQYENTINGVFGVQVNTSFDDNFTENRFRTTMADNTTNPFFIEKIYNNAIDVLRSINESDQAVTNIIYFCDTDRDQNCKTNFIKKWGRLLFRGELSNSDVNKISQIATQIKTKVVGKNNLIQGELHSTLMALLLSPKFYWLAYTPPTDPQLSQMNQIDLATKLSFFVWGQTPDDELLTLAENNQLSGRTVSEQIDRLIASPKAKYLAKELADNWLRINKLNPKESIKDYSRRANGDNKALIGSLKEQIYTFILFGIQENKNVDYLIDSDEMFHNIHTQELYPVTAKNYNNVEFNRSVASLQYGGGGGLLSHIATLSSISKEGDYSIFQRGPWIKTQLLCEPLGGVPSGLEIEESSHENMTIAESIQRHATDPTCAGCHQETDPYGAVLESFDSFGLYRQSYDNGDPIEFEFDIKGRKLSSINDLKTYITTGDKKDKFAKCLSQKVVTLASGYDFDSETGVCLSKKMTQSFNFQNLGLKDLIKEIISHNTFNSISNME